MRRQIASGNPMGEKTNGINAPPAAALIRYRHHLGARERARANLTTNSRHQVGHNMDDTGDNLATFDAATLATGRLLSNLFPLVVVHLVGVKMQPLRQRRRRRATSSPDWRRRENIFKCLSSFYHSIHLHFAGAAAAGRLRPSASILCSRSRLEFSGSCRAR